MTRHRPEASTTPNAPTATEPAARDRRDRRDRRVLLAVVLWIPIAITALGVAVLVAWAPRLPAEIVTKWGLDGDPIQTMSAGWLVVVYAGVALLLIAVIAVSSFVFGQTATAAAARTATGEPPRRLALVRPVAVFGPSIVAVVTVLMLGLTGAQLGGTEPSGWAVAAIVVGGVLIGAAIAVVTWHALPAPRSAIDPAPATPALALAPGERAAWSATVHVPWPVFIVVGLGVVAAVLPMLLDPASWPLSVVLLVVIGALATTLAARVTVDRRGLRVRTLLGMPLTRVPLDRVVSAADVEVSPTQFGGWGFRFDAGGRRGIIMRGGPAIEVARADRKPLVVTVPDARTGAALLNALARRDRAQAA